MKIALKPKAIGEIKDVRSSLARLHSRMTGANRELSKLENRQAELEEEISKLESADPGDKKARAALRDARDEQEAVNRRLEELNRSTTTAFSSIQGDQVFRAIHEARIVIDRALVPVLESRLAEITSVFRPFFRDDSWPRKAAAQSPAYIEFCNYTQPSYGRPSAVSPAHVARCIALCDEILEGELKFEFNP